MKATHAGINKTDWEAQSVYFFVGYVDGQMFM